MRILIALDESRHSELALESVKARTWPSDTRFCLCSVVNHLPAPSNSFQNSSNPALQKLQKETEAVALKLLQETKADLLKTLPGAQITRKIEFGPASEKIIETALKWNADVIIMGSHGRRGLQRYALGSVSESVVERAPCSVEIIKSQKNGKSILYQKRILVGYDGSPNADASLAWIAEGQWSPDQEFVLLSVLAPLEEIAPPRINEKHACEQVKAKLLAEAQEMLELRCSSLRRCLKGTPIAPVIIEGYAAETIIEFADQWGADLIVLGTHTAGANDNAPLGSVARRVVANAHCFVKLVKEKVSRGNNKLHALDAEGK